MFKKKVIVATCRCSQPFCFAPCLLGQPAQEQLTAALDALETALAASARQTASPSYFLNGSKPNMIDLMLLPMLERVEALLLHPFLQPSRLHLSTWPRIWAMLAEGRRPGVCSFGELTSDAETLLAISLREDPGRTPYTEGTQMDPTSLSAAVAAARGHAPAARREAAARVATNAAARQAKAAYPQGAPASVDAALRWVVQSLLREETPVELESQARRAADALRQDAAEALEAAAALRFLAQNVGVPRDMAPAPAAALRAWLRLLVAALEQRGPGKGIGRPRQLARKESTGPKRSTGSLPWQSEAKLFIPF